MYLDFFPKYVSQYVFKWMEIYKRLQINLLYLFFLSLHPVVKSYAG